MAAHLIDSEVTKRLDSYTGDVIWGTVEDLEGFYLDRVYPAFWETEIGCQFDSTYVWDAAVINRVRQQMAERFGVRGTPKSGVEYPGAILVWRLESIVGDLMQIHDPVLTLANPPEAPRPEPEHLRRARELKNIAAEVQADLGNGGFGGISVKEIKEKRRTNPDYEAAYLSMFPESTEATLPDLTDEAREFAEHYRTATSYDLKPKGGVYRLSGVSYGLQKFDRLMEIAVAHKLISGVDLRSITL